MLDLVQVHHVVVLDVLATARSSEEMQDIGATAAAFLVEALASFEMTQRGFMEKTSDSGRRQEQKPNSSQR
jgi:hypothetical protein